MVFDKPLGKLIRRLESGSTPNRIAWAFALGTIPGWTPLLCLHNVIVLALLFIFKVPLIAALIGFAAAGPVALVLTPFFHSIGYVVLVQVPFLKPLWTWLYNMPLAPLFKLNNTVVMGSLLFALVLLIPTVFLVKWLVARVNALPWKSAVKQEIKGPGSVLRWKGLIPFVLILGALTLITVLFADRWTESGLEKAGQTVMGARIEIDGFHVDLSKLTVKWDKLQATDPRSTMRNLIETDRAAFRMSLPALLRNRVVIREMTLADVRSGTPRKTDGALPGKKVKATSDTTDFLDKVKAKIRSEIETMPVVRFDLDRLKRNFNADSLVAIAGLWLPARLDSVKTDAAATASGWDAFFKTFHPEDDLAKVRDGLKDLDPKQIKTMTELLSALNTVQTSVKTVKAVSDTLTCRNLKFKQDYGRLSSYTGQLKTWVQDDYKSILAKAQLPDLSLQKVGRMVFGPHLASQADEWISRYQILKKYMPKKSDKPEKQKKVRIKGQDILFPDKHGWPTFAIEKLLLSGQTGPTDSSAGFRLRGDVTDISSQPWITGRPMIVSLSGDKTDGRSVDVSAFLDHRTLLPLDSFAVKFANVSLNHVAIEKGAYLPSQILKGNADFKCSAVVREKALSVQFNALARGLTFSFDSTAGHDTFIRVLRDILSRLDMLTLNAGVLGSGNDIHISLDSNLDDKVGNEFRRIGSHALTDAQNKIAVRLAKIENGKRSELARVLEEKQKAFGEKLSSLVKLSDEQKALVQEKLKLVQDEIDKRKKQEQDQLGKKAKDILDGVLKKK
jgi:uncharacterized protein (TIGR03545 family)/uncharacterized protein (TIGR03546 family)